MKSTSGFCLNSRRWVDFLLVRLPHTCPYEEEKDCQYECCLYWENKEMSKYAIKKKKIIWEK